MNLNIFNRKKKANEPVENRSDVVNLALPFGTVGCYETAMEISAVFNAVTLICNSIAQLPLELKSSNGTIDNSYIDDIFYNSTLGKFSLMKNMIEDMLLYGNGYAYIKRTNNGIPVELVYLPSHDVNIHWFKHTGVLYYTCNFIKHNIEPCDIIHIKKETNSDGIEGVGFVHYAARTIMTANYAENSAASFFEKGCCLNGILKYSGSLTEKQQIAINNTWSRIYGAQGYGGTGGGTAVVPANVDYIPITVNAKDAQLLESRLFSVQEVARFFCLPPNLLADISKMSYSSLEQSQLNFLLNCLSPIICMIEDEMTRKLIMPSQRSSMYINIDENFLLKADKQATANYLNTLVSGGILTVNEARNILGLTSVDGGDKNTVAYTKIEDNIINE